MQLLIVPDSFKESRTASQVAAAIERGVKRVSRELTLTCLPFSDGGEGALSILENHSKGKRICCATVDPIGRTITADYFLFENKTTAWIELSQASGLALLKKEERDPCHSSTFGTGLQIKHAIAKGCTKIILGVGGSATNDAGTGIFQALGGKLLDANQNELPKGGLALANLSRIVAPKDLQKIEWQVACDVENPLLGAKGASAVYAPQKGATPTEVKKLESSLTHFAHCVNEQLNCSIKAVTGGGAAGGTAAGMLGLFNAQLTPGFRLFSEILQLEEQIKHADLIITAEGKIDTQSLQGKVPVGVARLAKKHQTPCIGLVGAIEGDYSRLYKEGFSGIFSIQNGPMSLETSKRKTDELLEETAARVFAFHQNIYAI